MSKEKLNLASYIDHTLLRANATKDEIIQLCKEAEEYQFAAVCVNPYWVPLAVEQLKHSRVKVATVVGFPLGSSSTATKRMEAQDAVAAGAAEIDMVLNIGALKSGELTIVQSDIASVVQACSGLAVVKVILETGMLTEEEKRIACRICVSAGADFVKTSTGFGPGGASVEDISLMREVVGAGIGVKASGGIKNHETALKMIEAGATRIGTSSGVAILSGDSGSSPAY